jgi:hypothetical protein
MKNQILKKMEATKILITFFIFIFLILPSNSDSVIYEQSGCLQVTSPSDFYYNLVQLTWTKITYADHYLFEYKVGNYIYSLELNDNYLSLIASDRAQWSLFVTVGAIQYRISAIDSNNNIIEGPTDWAEFRCYTYHQSERLNKKTNVDTGNQADPGCLQITNPPAFHYNTILLAWIPIKGTDHYLFEFQFADKFYSIDIENNWLRIIADNPDNWKFLCILGSIAFRVTAIDSQGNVIDGPTNWDIFIKS